MTLQAAGSINKHKVQVAGRKVQVAGRTRTKTNGSLKEPEPVYTESGSDPQFSPGRRVKLKSRRRQEDPIYSVSKSFNKYTISQSQQDGDRRNTFPIQAAAQPNSDEPKPPPRHKPKPRKVPQSYDIELGARTDRPPPDLAYLTGRGGGDPGLPVRRELPGPRSGMEHAPLPAGPTLQPRPNTISSRYPYRQDLSKSMPSDYLMYLNNNRLPAIYSNEPNQELEISSSDSDSSPDLIKRYKNEVEKRGEGTVPFNYIVQSQTVSQNKPGAQRTKNISFV